MARTPIHPGEHLAEELAELGMSAAELARQIDVPVNRVTSIINGQRAVTADTALRLGHWFGTSAEFWLNLQKLYELRLAQQEIGADVESSRVSATTGLVKCTRPSKLSGVRKTPPCVRCRRANRFDRDQYIAARRLPQWSR